MRFDPNLNQKEGKELTGMVRASESCEMSLNLPVRGTMPKIAICGKDVCLIIINTDIPKLSKIPYKTHA